MGGIRIPLLSSRLLIVGLLILLHCLQFVERERMPIAAGPHDGKISGFIEHIQRVDELCAERIRHSHDVHRPPHMVGRFESAGG